MYNKYRKQIFNKYNQARQYFIAHPEMLVELEHFTTLLCKEVIEKHFSEFETDYNEASYLQPFWANYPPDDRGRAPKGDQIPWIEVGEHSIGHKISRILSQSYSIREVGLPSGADNRFVLSAPELNEITNGYTNSIMVFLDIKSVGPRDDAEHTVISPYQVSGDGIWNNPKEAMVNSKMEASGERVSHDFYPAISPIYVLSDGTIAPTIHIFIKPIYSMLSLGMGKQTGQPLSRIRIICVPNGLLLSVNPNYLQTYRGLFFPGKDDKSKPKDKVRCRVSFRILSFLHSWRVCEAKSPFGLKYL